MNELPELVLSPYRNK